MRADCFLFLATAGKGSWGRAGAIAAEQWIGTDGSCFP